MSRPACSGWCHPDGCICRPARHEMPAEVAAFVRRYTAAADRGDMIAALELRASWPAGLAECSCLAGEVEDAAGDAHTCPRCEGWGLYYQPESEAA